VDNHGSITGWVACLSANDEHAAQRLYQRYLLGLMTVAKARLRGARRGMADEEDLAHQALTAFFDRVRQGGFPQLADRHDVWQVLVMLTERRVADQLRRGCRRKRGNGIEQGESSIPLCGVCVCQARPIEQVVAQAPSAEAAAEFMELYQRLMDSLGNRSQPGGHFLKN
jgi:hypothetical protein